MTGTAGTSDQLTEQASSVSIESANPLNILVQRQDYLNQRMEKVLTLIENLKLPPDSREELIDLREMVRGHSLTVEALAKLPGHRSDLSSVLSRSVAEDVGKSLRPTAQSLKDTSSSLREELRFLQTLVEGARKRKSQNWALGFVAALMLVTGFVLYPLAAAILPGGSYLAAFATWKTNLWQAGWTLLRAENIEDTDRLDAMQTLYKDNSGRLNVCSHTLRITGKPQRCELLMRTPLPITVNAQAGSQ